MPLETCPQCNVRVIPSAGGVCPTCRRSIHKSAGSLEVAATVSSPYESPAPDQAGDDDLDQRRLVYCGGWMFLCIVGINLLPLLWAAVSGQPIENPGLGTFLSVALLYFLWRGQPWAKWITVALFSFFAVALIPIGLFKDNVQLLIGGGLLAAVPLMLLFSRSLNAFLLEQRCRL